MSEEFNGDVYIYDTVDGSEFVIKNGLVMPDEGLKTAVYLSLFGGNEDDTEGGKNSKTWWGNRLIGVRDDEKLVNHFLLFIRSVPITSKNIVLAEEEAMRDLQWMKDNGISDSIGVKIYMVEKNRIELKITIEKNGDSLESEVFNVQWEAMKNGI